MFWFSIEAAVFVLCKLIWIERPKEMTVDLYCVIGNKRTKHAHLWQANWLHQAIKVMLGPVGDKKQHSVIVGAPLREQLCDDFTT